MKKDLRDILKKLFCIILLLSIGFVIGCLCNRNEEKEVSYETDTFSIVKYDTITNTKTKFVKVLDVDTIEIVKKEKDTIYLPIVQKQYSDSLWSLWISGVEPLQLDSIHFAIPQKTITNTIKEKVIDKKPHLYGGFGFDVICGDFSSNLIVSSQLNNRWLIGANIGVLNNELTYGVKLQIKIF